MLSGSPLREDKRNRAIPVLDFVGTAHDFVIAIMPVWDIDLFAADIYNLGKTLERELRAAYKQYGDEHIDPKEYKSILSAMTGEPAQRPTAAEVLAALRSLFSITGC
ncbi:hypothetical protein B0H14DRAFT_3500201 [Mycena olivaceomarginata]|nr:hypothetical protein B0H14DRAFT_3500201 [Mycena olivaceomarginata]